MNEQTTQKVDAEIAKLIAETGHINTQSKWHPSTIIIAAIGAGSALTLAITAVLKFIGAP